jgi:hypothetical protein
MKHRLATAVMALLAGAAAAMATPTFAHSASDAYLSLQRDGAVVHAQWDIALRDLDFVLGLDVNGDGDITWGELRARQQDIAGYAYARLRASNGEACTFAPTGQKVATHPDGTYTALFFDIRCSGPARGVKLDYLLFFALDPSHRAIVTMQSGTSIATALLAPDNATITLKP